MINEKNTSGNPLTFKDFLFMDRRNRIILFVSGISVVIQFAIFKYLYPYASFIHGDSFSYIRAAYLNLNINTYLIGYSKFLRLFSVFAKSDSILVLFQYLFIQCSVLYLLFTLFYLYKPRKAAQLIILCLMIYNPLFLHLGNLISSDGFFLGLSMIWFTLLLWIIHQPSKKIIIWHSVVLFIAFTVRYNAMIYPFISAVAFYLSKLSFKQKILNFGASIALCISFVIFTSYQYKKLTSHWQYSPFSGWQLANNAMYAYRYVNKDFRIPVPKKFQALDNMIREYFDSTRDVQKFPLEKIQASTFYMWSPGLPLMKYSRKLFINDTSASDLKIWASMGPLFKSYGLYIIRHYPKQFVRYFMWPNASKYFAPPIEFLETFNSGKADVSPQAKAWFGYKTAIINNNKDESKVWILNFYPILSGAINVSMACLLICYLLLRGWTYGSKLNKAIIIGSTMWLLNACFTISASSAALRFQSFPIILTIIYTLLLLEWMTQLINITSHQYSATSNDYEKIQISLNKG